MDNKVKELRNTPLGHLTKIGRIYYSAIIFSPRDGYVDKVCSGCSFSEEGGAKDCEYSPACMAHLRPDMRSVIFVKIDRPWHTPNPYSRRSSSCSIYRSCGERMAVKQFTMVHASLFSGFGAADLAATWMGWDNAFWCEIDDFCRTVLSYWFPKSEKYGNIKETDFTPWRGKIDILTGGFPCQPFSVAGQRKGADDDRYLWPEMLRAIREIRPTWVVGENVAGILSMVQPGDEITVESQTSLFEEADKETVLEQEYVIESVCRSLEQEGYKVKPVVIPACAVGAPHRRDRVFFIAHRADARVEGMRREGKDRVHGFKPSADTDSQKLQTRLQTRGRTHKTEVRARLDDGAERSGGLRYAPDPDKLDGDLSRLRTSGISQFEASGIWPHTNPDDQRCPEQCLMPEPDKPGFDCRICDETRPDWRDFPTQSPVRRGNDGLPFDVVRLTIPLTAWCTGSIKGYGNAIVPQVLFEIFKAIGKVSEFE